MELSSDQKTVLEIEEGRHLILAPPGSGKTELLVQRLDRVIKKGANPESLACLTFTNRAARSMQSRVGNVSPEIHIGNFHSLALRLLKKHDVFKTFYSVLKEEDAELVVDIAIDELFSTPAPTNKDSTDDPLLDELESEIDLQIAARFNMQPIGSPAEKRPLVWLGRRAFKDQLKKLILPFNRFFSSINYNFPDKICRSEFKLLRKALSYPDQKEENVRPLIWMQVILLTALKKLSIKYKTVKIRTKSFDYDDLIIELLRWLIDNPEVEEFNWVQVDECQDLNDIQWEILHQITNNKTCLLLFADQQQSIYSFMGSNIETLDENSYGYETYNLSINYRSPAYLLDLYRDFIHHNMKLDFAWKSFDTNVKKENNLRFVSCASDLDEQYYLVNKIIPQLLEESDGNIAILTRSNRLASEISEALASGRIDHFIVSQFDLFHLKVTKDFMAFLHLLATPEAKLPWLRLLSGTTDKLSLKEALKIVDVIYEAGLLPHWFLMISPMDRPYPPIELVHLAMTSRVVVLDTETTGTDPFNDDIIQIAAVEIIQGNIGRDINLFLQTDKNMDESIKIHGITKEDLKEKGIDRKEAFQIFLEFIGDDPICAHNMSFDLAMLDMGLKRTLNTELWDSNPTYCTLEIARALDPDSPNHKLETLIERYGLEGKNTHDALDDVLATCNLVLSFEKKANAKRKTVDAIYDNYMYIFNNLANKFGPFFAELRKPTPEKRNFNWLFEQFLSLNLSNGYQEKHITEIKRKLLRHMELNTDEAPVRNLLSKELHPYQLYRESDLIMESDRIVVSTVHRAKSLEFETVVIPSCHKSSYPNYYATLDKTGQQVEEEKRVLYVAMTRAKRKIVIMQPCKFTSLNGKDIDTIISPFIEPLLGHFQQIDLSQHYESDRSGTRSKHSKHKCTNCGRTWPWDGSRQGDDRCFGCGHVPD